jgi:hypothetical protein
MRIRVDPNAPSIARRTRRYERKLNEALAIAAKRAARHDARLVRHFSTAKVEGLNSRLRTKDAAVTFVEDPFRGSLIQIYDWKSLDEYSISELADGMLWSLNHSLKRDPFWAKRSR